VVFTDEYLNRKIDINFEAEGLPTLLLNAKPHSTFIYRLLALITLLWSLVLLITETMLIFTPREAISVLLLVFETNVWYTFCYTLTMMCLVIATAFFTIFKLRFSDYLQMVRNHTDAVTMTSFCGLFSQLITVACFNYMVMAD
jgi:hypothetical protein